MKLLRALRAMFSRYDDLSRPSFPVDSRLTQIRGSVDDVKPLYKTRRAPIDYERGRPIG